MAVFWAIRFTKGSVQTGPLGLCNFPLPANDIFSSWRLLPPGLCLSHSSSPYLLFPSLPPTSSSSSHLPPIKRIEDPLWEVAMGTLDWKGSIQNKAPRWLGKEKMKEVSVPIEPGEMLQKENESDYRTMRDWFFGCFCTYFSCVVS